MTEKSRKYLSDIITAIEFIDEFISGIHDFTEYQKDKKTKSAVERQLIIIGEAVNNFQKESGVEINSSVQIVNFINRIVHAYDSIDDSIVWVIMSRHLPELRKEVKNLMELPLRNVK
jgi:uncharacterized protein with HEPN domain